MRHLVLLTPVLAAAFAACSSSPDPTVPTDLNTDTAGASAMDTGTASDAATDAEVGPTSGTETPSATDTGTSTETGGVMLGGFKDQDPATPDVVTAANKAVELLKTQKKDPTIALKAVKSARMQIVAGRNYDLVLDLTTSKGPKTVTVRVLQDLKNNYSVGEITGL